MLHFFGAAWLLYSVIEPWSVPKTSLFLKWYVSIFIGEKEYYEKQFATLKSFEEVDSIVTSDCADVEVDCADVEDIGKQAEHERAMKISNYANAVLLALKVIFIRFICSFSNETSSSCSE